MSTPHKPNAYRAAVSRGDILGALAILRRQSRRLGLYPHKSLHAGTSADDAGQLADAIKQGIVEAFREARGDQADPPNTSGNDVR